MTITPAFRDGVTIVPAFADSVTIVPAFTDSVTIAPAFTDSVTIAPAFKMSPHLRESGFRNPVNFCLWDPESGKRFAREILNPGLWNPES